MSPTEHDLRAALRDGEGDAPSAGGIVARGRALRAKRRSHLLYAAVAIVLVGGVGVGGAFLLGNSTTDSKNNSLSGAAGGASSDNTYGQAHSGGTSGSAKALVPSRGGVRSPDAVACPSSLPRYLLPGGSRAGQLGGDGPLFRQPVRALVVCSYGAVGGAVGSKPTPPARLVLTGNEATVLADSLEHAAKTKPAGLCPDIRSADEQALAILGLAGDGSTVGTVTTTINRPACAVQVTNGSAVRYAWTPPPQLAPKLAGLNPQAGRSHGPVVPGSPSR